MITVNYGETVRATCKFDYSGSAGYFTFALEIGTWVPPIFNTLNRWETPNVYVAPGIGKQQVISFVVTQVSGLNRGTIYDMNWEIGTGSQQDNSWKFIARRITDDIIKIAEEAILPVFSNLSVSYVKA